MIRAFASKYNYPIYIVNPGNINLDYLDKILSPKSSNETIILVFEDFDRFLENRKAAPVMSQILNSLDGLQDSSNVIRFFTGNDCDVIFNNKALINRMSAKFKFDYPTRDMFKVKLLRLLQHTVNKDQAKIDEYVDMIAEKNISMRPFISYSIRYLFDENPLEKMIANIDELNTS
ncbi:MAG: AAA family ATPase [Hyperionvirus sp.]|uniref:AAA family ATPase n=1 Tax=Hyperionvirus sp. TaxID=2487770 RepID=A0A3G5A5J8_9VIRU|nr:MAG: AAA family ATPase [Hyperionvirus sp.]